MKKKVAINGFGRIGRLAFRLLMNDPDLQVVAINNGTAIIEDLYLSLKYDSNFKEFDDSGVSYDKDGLILKGRKIKVFGERDASKLPWKDLGIDVVLECTGAYTNVDDAMAHIEAGAKHVLISAPAKGDCKTIVYGVNDKLLKGNELIVSAASCTTNCLAPVLNVLDKKFGIRKGFMTTVHAVTNDQGTLDVLHKKGAYSRRGRSAMANIIPASTGAATAIGLVLPNLKGKLSGSAFRVPVIDGSVIDLTLELKVPVSKEAINKAFTKASNDVIQITQDPVVSSDIIGSHLGALVDGLSTDVLTVDRKQLVKVVAWYDNELGYTAQMIRTLKVLAK